MTDNQAKLENLQQADIAIFEVKKELEGYELQLGEMDKELEQLKEKIEEHEKNIEEQNKEHSDQEKMLFIEQERLKRTRSKLQGTSIKNPHAYHANQREIEKVRKDIEAIEVSLLELMEVNETEQSQLDNSQAELDEKETQRSTTSGEIGGRVVELNEKCDELEKKRESLAGRIDSAVLPVYEKLHGRYPQNSVVAARKELCLGCHMLIPPQLYNELQRGEKFITCPACGRILFFQPENGDQEMEAVSG